MPIDSSRLAIPADLPIASRAEELIAAIASHQVIVVAGATGSGKSTQLPKLCLAAGRGVTGIIGHTQPRRVAARAVADRVADELGVALGDEVGYSVRFTDKVGESTRIRVMTDGILLAELSRDPELRRYDTIIIDEAHERSLNVDFLLGYLRRLLERRSDLHVIVTSATIDTERFAAHFANAEGTPAPVFIVEGRTYPVEVRYRPIDEGTDQVQAIINALHELERETDGDVLVFLSGEREIHDTADAIRELNLRRTEVLPLYARLSAAEQHRVFAPHAGRRIVLSTNVAETSITVPGVRAVIDTGTARMSRYSRRLKVQRLPIEDVSQASADQRSGRCGRVAPGIAIRLWSSDDHDARPAFTEPEILRTNLASVILQMTSLGLGDVAAFPFVEPPDAASINDGYSLLLELGALTGEAGGYRLTKLGRRLARLPVDPRLGRMIIEADRHGCVREVLIIASALSIRDVRERPREQREQADALHRRFDVPGSDLMSIVVLWDHLRDQQRALSSNGFRRLCRDEYLNWLRVREWRDLYSQLRQVAGQIGIRPGTEAGHPDRVHQAVLAGLLSHIGVRDDQRGPAARQRKGPQRPVYAGARGARFEIAPGSVLARRGADWVMAAEIVETERLMARRVAAIDPAWAERAGSHLLRRSYGDPEWDASSMRAVVAERATLYGVPVVDGRRIGLERVDPGAARQMFIEHALVRREADREWLRRQRFLHRNDVALDEIAALSDRLRRDVTPTDDELIAFFESRLPDDVVSGRHFDRWWRDERSRRPHLLDLTAREALPDGVDVEGLPDVWIEPDGAEYSITYRHDPGSVFDGATIHIPLTAINRFVGTNLEWHLPAYRGEIVEELFATLPKELRRRLIPANDTIAAATQMLNEPDGERSLVDAVAGALTSVSGVEVRSRDLDPTRLPTHLRLHLVVSDDTGEVHAFGDDIDEVRDLARPAARSALASRAPIEERSGIVSWDLGTLPETVEWSSGGEAMMAHPTLLDRGDSVSLRLVTDRDLQRRLLREGVTRLLLLTAAPSRSLVRDLFDNDTRLALSLVGMGADGMIEGAQVAVVHAMIDRHGLSWDAAQFAALQTALRVEGPPLFVETVLAAIDTVRAAGRVLQRLDTLRAPAAAATVSDAHDHVRRLVGPGWIERAGRAHLGDVQRYVDGIAYRLDHLAGHVERDRRHIDDIVPLERALERRLAAFPRGAEPATLIEAGWMLEELRMSLFAQPLGVNASPSPKRVQALLDA